VFKIGPGASNNNQLTIDCIILQIIILNVQRPGVISNMTKTELNNAEIVNDHFMGVRVIIYYLLIRIVVINSIVLKHFRLDDTKPIRDMVQQSC